MRMLGIAFIFLSVNIPDLVAADNTDGKARGMNLGCISDTTFIQHAKTKIASKCVGRY